MSILTAIACLATMRGACQHIAGEDTGPRTFSVARLLPEVVKTLDSAHRGVRQDPTHSFNLANAVLMVEPLKFYSESAIRSSVIPAARLWEQSVFGLTLTEVNRASQADIVFVTTDNLRMDGQDIGGYANWQRFDTGDRPLRATVQIRPRQPNGKPMTVPQLFHIVGHEIGHLLGLADSPSQADMMGPLNLKHPVVAPTTSEIQALNLIREEAWEIRRQAANSLLNLNQGYNGIREARPGPATELPGRRRR